jgi:hypothetical protein
MSCATGTGMIKAKAELRKLPQAAPSSCADCSSFSCTAMLPSDMNHWLPVHNYLIEWLMDQVS